MQFLLSLLVSLQYCKNPWHNLDSCHDCTDLVVIQIPSCFASSLIHSLLFCFLLLISVREVRKITTLLMAIVCFSECDESSSVALHTLLCSISQVVVERARHVLGGDENLT